MNEDELIALYEQTIRDFSEKDDQLLGDELSVRMQRVYRCQYDYVCTETHAAARVELPPLQLRYYVLLAVSAQRNKDKIGCDMYLNFARAMAPFVSAHLNGF